MRTIIRVCTVALTVSLMTVGDASARGGGGRGGGGRGGGGFSRGGGGYGGRGGSRGYGGASRSVSRSPSISRSVPSYSRPSTGMYNRPSAVTRPGTGGFPSASARLGTGARPSHGDLQNFMDLPRPSTGAPARPGAGSRPGSATMGAAAAAGFTGVAAADFLRGPGERPGTLPATGQRPGAGISDRPGIGDRPSAGDRPGIGDRPGAGDQPLAGNRPAHIEDRQNLHNNRFKRCNEVWDQVQHNYPRLDFWSDHPNWARWRITRPYRWATWAGLTGWVAYGWSEPIYYTYGENTYYEDDSVYYEDEVVASADEYAQQAEEIAASASEVAPDETEWMPLGVFALTPDDQASGPDPSLFLQLAISKEGIISGTLHNSATDSTQTIEGMVDKETQRTAWTVAGKSWPVMECGVSSLTEDTAPALVHFEDGQTQQWLMVRLQEPTAQS